jgi:hypothetical protein
MLHIILKVEICSKIGFILYLVTEVGLAYKTLCFNQNKVMENIQYICQFNEVLCHRRVRKNHIKC